jgi:hypothetical protein
MAGTRAAPSAGCSMDPDPHGVRILTQFPIFSTGTRQKRLDVLGIENFLVHGRRRCVDARGSDGGKRLRKGPGSASFTSDELAKGLLRPLQEMLSSMINVHYKTFAKSCLLVKI